jgi:hypothetical protein
VQAVVLFKTQTQFERKQDGNRVPESANANANVHGNMNASEHANMNMNKNKNANAKKTP